MTFIQMRLYQSQAEHRKYSQNVTGLTKYEMDLNVLTLNRRDIGDLIEMQAAFCPSYYWQLTYIKA